MLFFKEADETVYLLLCLADLLVGFVELVLGLLSEHALSGYLIESLADDGRNLHVVGVPGDADIAVTLHVGHITVWR